MNKFIKYIIIFILCISLIPSCMMGGIAVSGAQAIYDRKNIQKKLDDNYTTLQAYREIYFKTNEFQNTHISIATFNDSLIITGQIPEATQKEKITKIVKNLSSDREVFNFTEIATPSSTLTRASDTWITSKIKAKLIAANNIDPSKIKVLTENGTVFLMGITKKNEATKAIEITKNTSGVQGIVKVFSYIEIIKEKT
ncbi:BON domain-containing protein [Gammaproteobacteria bacterium]|nr:BON domain-containing protein [Gammaproteobacteria bacterium]